MDGPRKGMTPDPDSDTHPSKRRRAYASGQIPEGEHVEYVQCEKCGGMVRAGDWPWCSNQDYRTHWRDFTPRTAEVWSEASKSAKRPNDV